jgi:hypothetical protein
MRRCRSGPMLSGVCASGGAWLAAVHSRTFNLDWRLSDSWQALACCVWVSRRPPYWFSRAPDLEADPSLMAIG